VDSVNQTLTTIETAFQTVVWNPLWAAGEAALLAAVPVLNAPVLKQIEEFGEETIRDTLYHYIVQLIDIEYIQLKDTAKQAAWADASIKLKTIEAESGVNSDAYKQALQIAAINFSKFVTYNQ
jgi:hypothetical protein